MKRGMPSDITDGDGSDTDSNSARADFDYEDEVAQASAVLALRLDPESSRSADRPSAHSASIDTDDERLTRERNRLHAKSTRERKKQRLTQLQQRAMALETEIDELMNRGEVAASSEGRTTQVASTMAEGLASPLTMADLQNRAAKLSMRVAAQDLMLTQLQRDNAMLMAQLNAHPSGHLQPESSLAPPHASHQIPSQVAQRQFYNPNVGMGGFPVSWPNPALRHETPELNRQGRTHSASELTQPQHRSS